MKYSDMKVFNNAVGVGVGVGVAAAAAAAAGVGVVAGVAVAAAAAAVAEVLGREGLRRAGDDRGDLAVAARAAAPEGGLLRHHRAGK